MALPIDPSDDPIRIVVVDDTEDMRLLLRLQFGRDKRFEVVGEAANGLEAIERAEQLQPDLMILDLQMPELDGLSAMPEIRRVAPDTAIVLYTANADPGTYQAAVDNGALQVLEKHGGSGMGLIDQLVRSIAERTQTSQLMDVSVGPVSSQAVRVWVANTEAIIDAVAAHPEVLPEDVPEDVYGFFKSLLTQWGALAESTDIFRWQAMADPNEVRRIIEHWAVIDAMTDEQLGRLGVSWSPPEGAPFFQALTTGVLEALRRHEGMERLASRLGAQWAPYRD